MNKITYQESLKLKNVLYVDVRTEKEFADGTIKGAYNLPIFNNEERAEIGYTYKHIGKKTAKEQGLEVASPKLPEFYRVLRKLSKDYNHIVIFCARGGMRSGSIATVMKLMQLNVYQMDGGYKAYRNYVLDRFEDFNKNKLHFIALHGNTGCGKTDLLRDLHDLDFPVLDLEGLANHRGSVFGAIGLGEQPSQKVFEDELFHELLRLKDGPILVEAENPKIGKRLLPACVIDGITEGVHVLIECSDEERIKRLVKDYSSKMDDVLLNKDELLHALSYIKPYMPTVHFDAIYKAIDEKNLEEAASLLLVHYYDPRYNQWKKKYGTFDYTIDTTDMEKCIANFYAMIQEQEAALTKNSAEEN